MPPALNTESQLAPSQFAYFKATEPLTTASGITPGQALLDTPSPDRPPVVLERAQRVRKPSARKAEASQSQVITSKPKGKESVKSTVSKPSGKNLGNASSANASISTINPRPHTASTGMAERSGPDTNQKDRCRGDNGSEEDNNNDLGHGDHGSEEGEDAEYVSQAIIDQLEGILGHSVNHLSGQQLKKLLEATCATQASAMETQAEHPPAIAQPLAGVGLAGRDCNGPPSHEGSGSRSVSQGQNKPTNGGSSLNSQKRPLDTNSTPTTSKHVRISDKTDDSQTEDESDGDSDMPRRRRADVSDSDSDPDSDPDSEAEPRPMALSRPPKPLASSQGGAAAKATYSKSTSISRPATSARRLPSLVLANPLPSTSSNNSAAPKPPFNASTYLARYPPPDDPNDIAALTTWAIQVAKERAQVLDNSTSSSRSQQPTQPNTTADHVARALASHRSQINRTDRPSSQATLSRPSQSISADPISSRASTPNGIDTSATDAGSALSRQKTKRSAKAKLSDFPGRPGEVASAAIPYFLSTVFAEGGYENTEIFRDWALDAYCETWKLEFPEYEYEPPPRALVVVVTRRVSWLRGEVRKRIRSIVQYGYGFRNPADTRADKKHNRRLAKKLGPNVFHCRDLLPDTNHFEHPEFIRAIGAGLFWDPESLGVVFRQRFELVPLPAVALILTMMQSCINEWKLGSFKAEELDADKQQVEYERHLLSLYEYEKVAAGRLNKFRTKWSAAGLKYSGATDEDPTVVQSYILAGQIRPDTPPPEDVLDA